MNQKGSTKDMLSISPAMSLSKIQVLEKGDQKPSHDAFSIKKMGKSIASTNKGSQFQLMDVEQKTLNFIKGFCVYQNINDKNNDYPQLKREVELTFKTIAAYGENNQGDQQVKNLRLNKHILKSYLTKRYNKRLANKLCSLFDWSNQLDYKEFYIQLDALIVNSGICSKSLDQMNHIISLKQIAFNLYDMNCDNHICEYDLFSIIRHTDNSLFCEAINQDFKDIRAKMAQKQLELMFFDYKKSIDEKTLQIRDLKRWLNERDIKRQIQSTFLKVFTSPKHYPHPGKKPIDDKSEGASFSTAEAQRKLEFQSEMSTSSIKKQGMMFSKKDDIKESIFKKAAEPLNDRIKDMQQTGQQSGENSYARRKSLAHLVNKTDQLYHRKDQTKIKMDEYSLEVEFKYGVPMIILDVLHAFTGFNIINHIKEDIEPSSKIDRMNPDSFAYLNYKNTITEEF